MPRCPNCGQPAERTEDWACRWCGYPLLSPSFKKIAKTYQQLKEEALPKPEPVMEEAEPEPAPVLESELEPVSEPESEPVLETKPEAELAPEAVPEPISEPEPTPKPKPRAKRKTAARTKSASKTTAEAKPAARHKRATKAESATEAEPKPSAKAEPEPASAAIEITVEELLSAYETDGEAADARFANKILKVTGVVDRIEVKDILDIHYITLSSAEENLLRGMRCVFDREHGAELNQLTVGQTVTVQGTYDGSIIDIRMRECVLVS